MGKNALDQQMHRYKVWLLAKDQAGVEKPEQVKPIPPASKQLSKLTDMETLLLLYQYGRPMDIAVDSRFTLPDGQAATCKTKKISSESVDFVYNEAGDNKQNMPPRSMSVGSPLSLEIDEVGSVGGVLTAQSEDGFKVTVDSNSRNMLSNRLAHIAVKRGLGVDASTTVKTGVPRIEPVNKNCNFTDHTGTVRKGMIVNLSQYDALIRAAASFIPPIGTRIVLRGPEWHGAYVISTFEIGFVVKFCIPIPPEQFSPAIRFSEA